MASHSSGVFWAWRPGEDSWVSGLGRSLSPSMRLRASPCGFFVGVVGCSGLQETRAEASRPPQGQL